MFYQHGPRTVRAGLAVQFGRRLAVCDDDWPNSLPDLSDLADSPRNVGMEMAERLAAMDLGRDDARPMDRQNVCVLFVDRKYRQRSKKGGFARTNCSLGIRY